MSQSSLHTRILSITFDGALRSAMLWLPNKSKRARRLRITHSECIVSARIGLVSSFYQTNHAELALYFCAIWKNRPVSTWHNKRVAWLRFCTQLKPKCFSHRRKLTTGERKGEREGGCTELWDKVLCSLYQTIDVFWSFHRICNRTHSNCQQNKYKSGKLDGIKKRAAKPGLRLRNEATRKKWDDKVHIWENATGSRRWTPEKSSHISKSNSFSDAAKSQMSVCVACETEFRQWNWLHIECVLLKWKEDRLIRSHTFAHCTQIQMQIDIATARDTQSGHGSCTAHCSQQRRKNDGKQRPHSIRKIFTSILIIFGFKCYWLAAILLAVCVRVFFVCRSVSFRLWSNRIKRHIFSSYKSNILFICFNDTFI